MTDLDYIEQEAKLTTLSGAQMVKRYGPDTSKWPTGHWRNLLDRVTATLSPPPPPPPPPPTTGARYFAADSPWNVPLPAVPAIRPESATWVQYLYDHSPGGINVNMAHYAPVIQTADASAPHKTWRQFAWAGGKWILDDVPTPANMVADTDEHYNVLLDTVRRRAYHFLDADPASLGFETGVPFRLDGSGWWTPHADGPWAGSAAGAAYLAGTILKADVAAKRIPHVLYMAAPKNTTHGSVFPASTSDGQGPNPMPQGSKLFLDRSFDYTTTGLPSGDLICEALRDFGVIICDSNGPDTTCVLLCENYRVPSSPNPYPSYWGGGLPRELLRHLHVMVPPSSPPVYDDTSVFGQPHT